LKNKNKKVQVRKTTLREKVARGFAISFLLLLILNLIARKALDHSNIIPIEFYFIINYLFFLYVLVISLCILYFFIFKGKILNIKNTKNIKELLTNCGIILLFLVLVIVNLRYQVIPMSMDLPRLITGRYEETNGTIESVTYINRHSFRGGSNKVQYVYVKEEKISEELKIEFEDGYNRIPQTIKKVYYLPHTLWGISAE